MNELIIATKNKGKVREFGRLLHKDINKISSLVDKSGKHFDVEETGTTFEENARLKAEQIAEIIQQPVIADDSGLVIDALNGEPGIYSARYAGEPTNDVDNYEKVLREMKNIPSEKRTAHFICVLALAAPGEETKFFTGKCHGVITNSPSGTNGFGYDPIFIPKGYEQTMAAFSADLKNSISHRYHAIKKFQQYLHSKGENIESSTYNE